MTGLAPQARFLGVTHQDIIDYDLPTHPLKDVDIKRARDALKMTPSPGTTAMLQSDAPPRPQTLMARSSG